MENPEKSVSRRLRGWRGRVVSLEPTPWLFMGGEVRSLMPGENMWRASRVRGGLRLRRAGSGETVQAPLRSVWAVRGRRVYLDAQALIVPRHVELMTLPHGYWDGVDPA